MLLLVALACRDEEPADPQPSAPAPETSATLPSTYESEPGTLGPASCEPTDHPLRLRCTLEVSVPNAATWTVREGDTVLRTFTRGARAQHEEILWGLPAETELTWEVSTVSGTASGTVQTGALPAGVSALRLDTTGEAAAAEHLMTPFSCQGVTGVVLFGTDGRMKWYETVPVLPPGSNVFGPSAGVTAAEWLPGDEIAMSIDGMRVARLEATGEWRFDVGGFEWPLHHDIAAIGDLTYALSASLQGDTVVDGLYVLDGEGASVATWDLADHLALTGQGGGGFWSSWWPGSKDWAHSNGLSADGAEHLLLSLRMHDAVARIVADPASPSFGEIEWALAGKLGGQVPSDFVWTDGGGFEAQHHPSPLSGGGMSVFDNGDGEAISRALFMDVDASTGEVAERDSWSVGQHCSIQGGAYELPGGGALVTCNDVSTVFEFVPGQAAPVWTGELSCAGNSPGRIDRARPVFLD
jgi:hypothetical protein